MTAWFVWSLAAALLPAQNYRVSTVAGRALVNDTRPPWEAVLETPSALAVDSSGVLYFADASSHRIYKIEPGLGRSGPEEKYAFGRIVLVAGAGGMFFDGDGGPAVDAHLASPNGIALAPDGTLYIADTNNNRLRAVSPDGIIRTLADGLDLPFGIAVNAEGVIYVSELRGGRVRRIGKDGDRTTVAERLVRPMGLAFDSSGALLIAESGQQRIHRLTMDGQMQIAAETGARSIPRSIAVDGHGEVYFSDPGTGLIRRIQPSGELSSVLTILIPNPMGLAARADGALFLSTATGLGGSINLLPAAQTALGSPIAGAGSRGREGISALDSLLFYPTGVARKADGTLLIAQPVQDVVRQVDENGFIRLYAGNSPGYGGDGGPVERASLSNVFGIAADSAGNVYLADSSNRRIRRVDQDGIITTLAADLSQPQHVAVGAAGNVYAGEPSAHRVRAISPDGSVRTLAGTGARGFSGDGGDASQSQLASPQGIAADAEGNIYIADTGNNRVRRVNAAGTIQTVIEVTAPQGLAIDPAGNLLITAGHSLYRLAPGGELERIAGDAAPGFSGDDGPAVESRWNQPGAIWVAANGDIFVVDRGNHRLRRLRPE
ncbi:MAG: SMP-30/gluconolactonase/LRE family protein [Bryobacterales bacterium]|nr:SMP-30/gluconolactonase/LRE family protein [Bryobacterales bacterium]